MNWRYFYPAIGRPQSATDFEIVQSPSNSVFKRGRKGGGGGHIAFVTRAFKAALDYRFASGEGNCSSSLCLDTAGNKRKGRGRKVHVRRVKLLLILCAQFNSLTRLSSFLFPLFLFSISTRIQMELNHLRFLLASSQLLPDINPLGLVRSFSLLLSEDRLLFSVTLIL